MITSLNLCVQIIVLRIVGECYVMLNWRYVILQGLISYHWINMWTQHQWYEQSPPVTVISAKLQYFCWGSCCLTEYMLSKYCNCMLYIYAVFYIVIWSWKENYSKLNIDNDYHCRTGKKNTCFCFLILCCNLFIMLNKIANICRKVSSGYD